MVIEIRRANFLNKGAELMLRATVQQIRARLPNAEIVMIPDSPNSYCWRGELCVKQKAWLHKHRIRWSEMLRVVPKIVRRKYGVFTDSEVDVVLDAAGFAYGDQWPLTNLSEAAASSARWKHRGTKLILLPQAFGPFSDSQRRRLIKRLAVNAALVFAREEESYRHLTKAAGEYPHIRTAPDFTNLIEGEVPSHFDRESNRFCVVPNYRMIDKTDSETSNRYIELVAFIVRHLQTRKAKPFLLVHEGPDDVWLAEQINGRLQNPASVVTETDALSIKGIIGQCDGVVSSRFHGLVSALSQGVPALGTTWSHKYQMLFQDYGLPEGVITNTLTFEEIRSRIDMLIDQIPREELRNRIVQFADKHVVASRRMWDDVFAIVED